MKKNVVAMILLAAALPSIARADDPSVPPDRADARDTSLHAIDRTWLYGDDARIADPSTAVVTSNVTYTNIGNDPTDITYAGPSAGATCTARGGAPIPCYSPFAGNVAQPGAMMTLGGELGLLPRISIQGALMMGVGGAQGIPSPNVGALAGIRVQVLPAAWTHTHVVASVGYLREAWDAPVYDDDRTPPVWLPGSPHGDNGGWFQLAFSRDIDRLRLGATFHGEHVFSAGRDPLDVMVNLGASYRVLGDLRLGAEYVGQDLEESFTPGAEGGARHFVGPTASLQLWRRRITIVTGPAVGLSSISPSFVGRLAASVGF